MQGQKGYVKGVRLYRDHYAVAVFDKYNQALSGKGKVKEGHLVGWVLTHPDPKFWKERLAFFDKIEGCDKDSISAISGAFYRRSIAKAYLGKELREGQKKQLGKPGSSVDVFIYNRTNCNLTEEVPDGDWLKRDKSDEIKQMLKANKKIAKKAAKKKPAASKKATPKKAAAKRPAKKAVKATKGKKK